jgi:amidase
VRPEVPRRAWTRPKHADNPLGSWYVACTVNESGEGPLAGRTVAVKDNIAVAGIPMMVGSATMESFVPRRDA